MYARITETYNRFPQIAADTKYIYYYASRYYDTKLLSLGLKIPRVIEPPDLYKIEYPT